VFAFLAVAALVIVVPGQDTALTIRNTLGGGRRAGIATACGVACGLAIWAVATAFGLAAVLVASEPVYLALKAVGAAYLLWLGACCVWHAIRCVAPAAVATATVAPRLAPRAAFRQGIVSNLGNPKIAVFFTSLLPQFTPTGSTFVTPLGLGLLFCLLTLGWLAGYAAVVAHAANVLDRPRARRALDAVTGTVLVALGLRLLSEGHKT
jgi:threonine/homoserine/homoserine lactone efflux protein